MTDPLNWLDYEGDAAEAVKEEAWRIRDIEEDDRRPAGELGGPADGCWPEDPLIPLRQQILSALGSIPDATLPGLLEYLHEAAEFHNRDESYQFTLPITGTIPTVMGETHIRPGITIEDES